LVRWEARDPQVYLLWSTMNGWVYAGFDQTYAQMGVSFDKLYYESDTFLLGKDQVMEGIKSGVFYQKPDGSVWIDLTADGLDEKLVLRSDGTAVYMTQDIGTAIDRFKDFPDLHGMVYTVGNEQDYHFKVLFLILQKLGYTWANNCFHLSYGMVDLPSGKMKSRAWPLRRPRQRCPRATLYTNWLGWPQILLVKSRSEKTHVVQSGRIYRPYGQYRPLLAICPCAYLYTPRKGRIRPNTTFFDHANAH
jgi:hypothetical protein